jgi:hypothetical protein
MHEPAPFLSPTWSRSVPFRWAAASMATTLLLLLGPPAEADPPEPQQHAVTGAAGAAASDTGGWGWWVFGSGLVAGAAITTYGLTIDCANGDVGCEKRASLPIWGGIGTAALASALGLAVVETGKQRVQVVPTVSLEAAGPRVGVVLGASLGRW